MTDNGLEGITVGGKPLDKSMYEATCIDIEVDPKVKEIVHEETHLNHVGRRVLSSRKSLAKKGRCQQYKKNHGQPKSLGKEEIAMENWKYQFKVRAEQGVKAVPFEHAIGTILWIICRLGNNNPYNTSEIVKALRNHGSKVTLGWCRELLLCLSKANTASKKRLFKKVRNGNRNVYKATQRFSDVDPFLFKDIYDAAVDINRAEARRQYYAKQGKKGGEEDNVIELDSFKPIITEEGVEIPYKEFEGQTWAPKAATDMLWNELCDLRVKLKDLQTERDGDVNELTKQDSEIRRLEKVIEVKNAAIAHSSDTIESLKTRIADIYNDIDVIGDNERTRYKAVADRQMEMIARIGFLYDIHYPGLKPGQIVEDWSGTGVEDEKERALLNTMAMTYNRLQTILS